MLGSRIWSNTGQDEFYRIASRGTKLTDQDEKDKSMSLAVVMGTLTYDKLRLIGGTGHWFHLAERLLPLVPQLSRDVWTQSSNASELFIIFQEKYGSEELDAFGSFLLATLISGGKFDSVFIGHASSVTVLSGAGEAQPIVEAQHFELSMRFVLDSRRPMDGLRSVSLSSENRTLSTARRFHELSHVYWHYHAKKKYNMITLPVWELLQQAVNRTCPGATSVHVTSLSSPSYLAPAASPSQSAHDHLSDPPPRLARKVRRWRNGSYLDPRRRVVPSPSYRLILIYQRDLSRRLLHAREVQEQLHRKMGLTSGTASWRVQLITHDPDRDPCKLIQLVRSATVLITPHGFQSILLLFQPLDSLLTELHPSLYFKPEVFGLVQAGIRENLGAQRSYLSAQGDLKIWYMWLLSSIMSWFPLRDAGYCTGNYLCRYLARLQEVKLDPRFEDRLVHFIKTAFP
jgi:hypothetical protein